MRRTLINLVNTMKSWHFLATIFAAGEFAALAGCGSVAPENLHPLNSGAVVEVQRNLRWDYPSTFVDWHEMLLAGTYRAAAEDPDGTYFIGDKPCFFQTHAEGGSKEGKHIWGRANVCGVYSPKLPGKPLKVFYVLGPVVDRIVLNDDGTPVDNLYADGDTASFTDYNLLVEVTKALEKGRYQMAPIQPPEGLLQGALKFK